MAESPLNIAKLIRDPEYVKNRIFIGNLPNCTREEVQSICNPYGRVLGSMVQKNFGFVQFDSEEIANKAAFALNKSTFKGNIITVRNAASKKPAQVGNPAGVVGATHPPMVPNLAPTQFLSSIPSAPTEVGSMANNYNNDCNDCEIIVVDKANTKYAEYIEDRLKRIQLRVDLLFPNLEVGLGKVLANIASRGCLYAVLVTPQHEEHNSITVNILHGQPTEHRNMPLEDAIKLITNDYNNNVKRNSADQLSKIRASLSFFNAVADQANEKHPEALQALFNLLAANVNLTVAQYDEVIKYLTERRAHQVKIELGNTEPVMSTAKQPDPEILIQKKLMNVLRKTPPKNSKYELLYPTLAACKRDLQLMELLRNVRVRKALDTLVNSPMLKTVEKSLQMNVG